MGVGVGVGPGWCWRALVKWSREMNARWAHDVRLPLDSRHATPRHAASVTSSYQPTVSLLFHAQIISFFSSFAFFPYRRLLPSTRPNIRENSFPLKLVA